MRIILIFLQTAAFLVLLAAVLFSLYLCADKQEEASRGGIEPSRSLPAKAAIFVFGNFFFDLIIFAVLAALNIWVVLGPLMKVEDPVSRTLQHLSVIAIQALFLAAVAVLSYTAICVL